MHSDLQVYKKKTGRDWVDLVVTFHPDYPNFPPFVRVVRPRFTFHTGRVTVGGSLCTDVLTMRSWNPMYDIVGLMVNIFSEITNGGPRIDFRDDREYSLREARDAFERVAGEHGWRTSGWVPDK
jgi:ubiquitin-conjugating enzyme E2 Q